MPPYFCVFPLTKELLYVTIVEYEQSAGMAESVENGKLKMEN